MLGPSNLVRNVGGAILALALFFGGATLRESLAQPSVAAQPFLAKHRGPIRSDRHRSMK